MRVQLFAAVALVALTTPPNRQGALALMDDAAKLAAEEAQKP